MSKISISPDVIFQPVLLGESLLLNVKTLTYFAFDPLGTEFWAAIQSSSDADQAIQQVVKASDRPASELQPKLHAILTGLQRSGLISITQ
jgi:hypothetical protein